jgi:hypothetical protein
MCNSADDCSRSYLTISAIFQRELPKAAEDIDTLGIFFI